MTLSDSPLIGKDEPAPVAMFNADGRSAFLILGDHAGNDIPPKLPPLSADDRKRHIAWDIGVRALGEALATTLDAPFIHQRYSRLVIDCNRQPGRVDAVPPISDGTPIPFNAGLTDNDIAARVGAIHAPYHDRIAGEIIARTQARRPTILLALHSFTPILAGASRPWDAGILHSGGDTTFATALLTALRMDPGITVGDNEPYQMDSTDYTIPRHAFPAHLPYAEIEVRQDRISGPQGVSLWCQRLAGACLTAHSTLERR